MADRPLLTGVFPYRLETPWKPVSAPPLLKSCIIVYDNKLSNNIMHAHYAGRWYIHVHHRSQAIAHSHKRLTFQRCHPGAFLQLYDIWFIKRCSCLPPVHPVRTGLATVFHHSRNSNTDV